MTNHGVEYDLPREKLQKRGVAALTQVELLQILIGSGNARESVSRIAKRSKKLLDQYGSAISYDQLKVVSGLGPARISHILASFELATRYPIDHKRQLLDITEALGLVADIRTTLPLRLSYFTIDGAGRLITQRVITMTDEHSQYIRKIFADALSDHANGMIVVTGNRTHSLIPSMFDLQAARDIRAAARLLHIKLTHYIFVNQKAHHELKVQYEG